MLMEVVLTLEDVDPICIGKGFPKRPGKDECYFTVMMNVCTIY